MMFYTNSLSAFRSMKIHITLALLGCMAAGAVAAVMDQSADTPQPDSENNSVGMPASPGMRETISSYLKLAMDASARGNPELAESFYNKLLDLDAPDEEKTPALWEMAGMYEKKHVFSKAIAVYEKIGALFPLDARTPEAMLKLGLLYRETGACQMAISKFYSVLNSALKINKQDLGGYKALTQQAQFEIADTYFLGGDYQQADKFFSMLKRLDLPYEDKARAEFKSTYCRFLLNDHAGAVVAARNFVRDFPDTKYVPECRYLLAAALKSMNRPQEATDEVLALLRAEKPKEKIDPENWTYWQKKTGNQLANDLYQQGEFIKALTIYQALAKLDNTPGWQLPVVYQLGLCFERLRLPPRAQEAYHFILDECKKMQTDGAPLPSDIETLRQMAQWHSDQVAWMQGADTQLQSLIHGKELPAESEVKATP